MTGAMPWRVAIGKELRALLPMWAAVMVGLGLSGAYSRLFGGNPALLVFVLGAFALGALSIGHEYSAGTLATLLALPVSRTQLLMAKLAALLTLFIPFAALMFVVTLWTTANLKFGGTVAATLVVLAVGMSVFVAPWMSMLARGPLGGVVFTVAVLVGVPSAVLLWQRVMEGAPEGGLGLTPWPFVVVSLVSAVLGWRAFTRLEAIDGARDFRVSARSNAQSNVPGAARRPALLALAVKEAQLQQMTFIVATMSFLLILVLVWAEQHHYGFARGLSYPMSVLHLIAVPILAGALASAEERSLGTLDSQALQPVAAWKQWVIKVSIAIGLALALGVGAPALLMLIDRGADLALYLGNGPRSGAMLVPALSSGLTLAVTLTVVSIYVSSFSTSGLRAAIVAVPVIAGLGLLGAFVLAPLGPGTPSLPWLRNFLLAVAERVHHGPFTSSETVHAWWVVIGVAAASVIALVGLLLRFGLGNHRAFRVEPRRLARQAAAIGLWTLISTVTVSATSAWYWTGTRNYITLAERTRHQRWQMSLDRLVAGFDGRVGACISDGSDMPYACANARGRFPMQSVMKLPVAVAVLDAVDHGKLRLDEPIVVRKQDLSVYVQPIAQLVGPDGFKTTIGDLMRRAIVDSDNAAVDILIARLGGSLAIPVVLVEKGLGGIFVDRDEKHLQSEINGLRWKQEYVDPTTFEDAVAAVPPEKRDAALQTYLHELSDTATPQSMTILLDRLDKKMLLSAASSDHLLDILRQTTTMPDRLKAGVPGGWTIGHKSGTSGEWRGVTAATNDVGIITGPKGEKIYISVFIAESRASATDRAALIANIARMAVDGYK